MRNDLYMEAFDAAIEVLREIKGNRDLIEHHHTDPKTVNAFQRIAEKCKGFLKAYEAYLTTIP